MASCSNEDTGESSGSRGKASSFAKTLLAMIQEMRACPASNAQQDPALPATGAAIAHDTQGIQTSVMAAPY